ncbi:glycosyltransferase [Flavobacterium pedocola]
MKNKPLKIARVTTLLDFGGQEQQYLSFTECKDMLKNDYVFSAIGHGGFAEKTIRERGFEVQVFNQNPSISNLKNIWLLWKWFRKIKPDVVHTAAAEANFHAVIAARLAGVKTVVAEEIGFPNHSQKARFIFRAVYRWTNKVICVSKAVKAFLIEIDEVREDKAFVLYNPVSQLVAEGHEKPEQFTIVCVGRLEKVKNQQLLLKAFSELDNKEARLIMVGDGRERASLEQLINKLNLQNRVTITGFSSDPGAYLTVAHLFVLPSLSEGFGIAAVEAMQLGLPCLCSNVGGIPEFVVENETGWLFDPKDEAAFSTKLNEICAKPIEELNQIGEKGRLFVKDTFTPEKYAVALENFYQELQ